MVSVQCTVQCTGVWSVYCKLCLWDTVRDVLGSTTIPNIFIGNFFIMLSLRIYTFLLALGLLYYNTTMESSSVYLHCDKTGFEIKNSITWNIKNSTDLREIFSMFFL